MVGAIERRALPGEWRTNVALGGSRHSLTPPAAARVLALRAAAAVCGDLVGVDLLRCVDGRYIVLEVNGAVDFTSAYRMDSRDPFEAAVDALLEAADDPIRVDLATVGSAQAGREHGGVGVASLLRRTSRQHVSPIRNAAPTFKATGSVRAAGRLGDTTRLGTVGPAAPFGGSHAAPP